MKDESSHIAVHPSSFRLHPSELSMATASKDIVVSNQMGLHARPAMQFVDRKSVMEMIILEASMGTPLRIQAEGEDAEVAVAKLAELFETKFGEE